MAIKGIPDFRQPAFKHLKTAGILARQRTHNPRQASFADHCWVADQKHGRANGRQGQPIPDGLFKSHIFAVPLIREIKFIGLMI
jgi:hypothetical protein